MQQATPCMSTTSHSTRHARRAARHTPHATRHHPLQHSPMRPSTYVVRSAAIRLRTVAPARAVRRQDPSRVLLLLGVGCAARCSELLPRTHTYLRTPSPYRSHARVCTLLSLSHTHSSRCDDHPSGCCAACITPRRFKRFLSFWNVAMSNLMGLCSFMTITNIDQANDTDDLFVSLYNM